MYPSSEQARACNYIFALHWGLSKTVSCEQTIWQCLQLLCWHNILPISHAWFVVLGSHIIPLKIMCRSKRPATIRKSHTCRPKHDRLYVGLFSVHVYAHIGHWFLLFTSPFLSNLSTCYVSLLFVASHTPFCTLTISLSRRHTCACTLICLEFKRFCVC